MKYHGFLLTQVKPIRNQRSNTNSLFTQIEGNRIANDVLIVAFESFEFGNDKPIIVYGEVFGNCEFNEQRYVDLVSVV